MKITLRHLRAFVEVARNQSFTRAAVTLTLSQPALTIAVTQFEAELGVRLFDRSTRRVRLTRDGESFLPTAERLLEDFDLAVSDMRAVSDRQHGRVTAAALSPLATSLLPSVVVQFTRSHPSIRIHMRDGNASSVQRWVRTNEVEFGIGSRWEADPELEFLPIMRDPYGLVCRSDHALARRTGPVRWKELEGYPFLGLGRDTAIRPHVSSVGVLPESIRSPQYEFSNSATLGGMLAVSLGVTVLPELSVPQIKGATFAFRKVTEPILEREICIITRKNRSPSAAAKTFCDMIRDCVPRHWAA